jgi:flagellar FliL protein
MADEDPNAKSSRGLIKYGLFGVGGLLLIVIGLGAGYLIFGSAQPEPAEEIEKIIERKMQEAEDQKVAEEDNASKQKTSKDTPEDETFVTIYHEFPGIFTTNLKESRRMLQVGIGVSTQYDDTVMVNVESHQLALRSVILNVLSGYSEEDVAGVDGRNRLAAELRDALNSKLEALENFGGIEEVHFTSFVKQ